MTTAAPEAPQTLSDEELELIHKYWRAANYLSVGQIYLMGNALLKESLKLEHIKPRLLGHWGTTPGLNLIYVHLNRIIKAYDLDMIYICGPGHGGPGMVANTYLEGTYSEFYPNIPEDAEGIDILFKQFSFPGGIPSHAAPETPGSIHEGGELGYAVSHAYGAALDNPDLIVACVVGDGEAESGPLATAWHGNKFLNPATDGAVLPILHLNGYKIANPTILARIPREAPEVADDRDEDAEGMDGPERGRRPEDRGLLAFPSGSDGRPRGQPEAHRRARGLAQELQARGAVRRERAAATGAARAAAERRAPHGREPARERRAAPPRAADAGLPRLRAGDRHPGANRRRGNPGARRLPPRRDEDEHAVQELPHVLARRARVEPAPGVVRGHEPGLAGRDVRVRRPPEPRRPDHGDPERAHLSGVARGLPPDRAARTLLDLRGVRPCDRLDVQPARQVAEGDPKRDPVAAPDRVAHVPPQLARLAPGPQRVLAPGSGLSRPRREQEGRGDPHLPPTRREHAAVGDGPLPPEQELCQRRRRGQAAGAAVPEHGRGDQALHRGHRHLGVGLERPGRRPGRRDGVLGGHPDARDSGRGRAAQGLFPAAEDARRQRRRPDAAPAAHRAPARDDRQGVRHAVHDRQADRVRLPRLSVVDPPADVPPAQPPQPARARVQGRGHDHDAVRHGRAQRPRPVPPRRRRDRPRHRARGRGRLRQAGDPRQAGRAPALHRDARRRHARDSGLEVGRRLR